jgi:hypothetical protein
VLLAKINNGLPVSVLPIFTHAEGFTIIQVAVLTELDGLHTSNAYGETPLINDDPARPNKKK